MSCTETRGPVNGREKDRATGAKGLVRRRGESVATEPSKRRVFLPDNKLANVYIINSVLLFRYPSNGDED